MVLAALFAVALMVIGIIFNSFLPIIAAGVIVIIVNIIDFIATAKAAYKSKRLLGFIIFLLTEAAFAYLIFFK